MHQMKTQIHLLAGAEGSASDEAQASRGGSAADAEGAA
jgi:hypothetical protein